VELRQLQAQPELLASTEAFKTSERELSIAQRELQKLLDTYRAALGLYHRTVCRPPGRQAGRQKGTPPTCSLTCGLACPLPQVRAFQQLRFEVAQCCAQELSLVVELQLQASARK
jgi:hypothetical protein